MVTDDGEPMFLYSPAYTEGTPLFEDYVELTPEIVEARVHEQLKEAGLEPEATLREMRRYPAIISGSTAIPVLTGATFEPNDLDIYSCPPFEKKMFRLVTEDFGFSAYKETSETEKYRGMDGISRVHWLRKGSKVINLIIVPGDNPITAIFHFHTTLVMNYISGYGVFCAYPELTLARLATTNTSVVVSETQRRRIGDCIDKYSARGFEMRDRLSDFVDHNPHLCGTDPLCPATIRSLHDSSSLFIPFPGFNAPGVRAPVFDGETSVIWSLGGTECMIEGTYNRVFAASVPIFDKRRAQTKKEVNNMWWFDEVLMRRAPEVEPQSPTSP
ncbi:hypothetical protein R3P38DRAFT_2801068 [Favolaschia claudopus]|uniref:Uncharacterized protein n=1 Tax=Favolaschia claudopus TaxID=2862362 RepID=A0AAV9ZVT0_9AGAR